MAKKLVISKFKHHRHDHRELFVAAAEEMADGFFDPGAGGVDVAGFAGFHGAESHYALGK